MVDREMLAAMGELLDRKLDEKLDQKFSENLKSINGKLDRLEKSVEKLDARTSRLEEGMERLEERTSKLEERTSRLEEGVESLGRQTAKLAEKVEKLDKRTSKLEADMTYIKVVQLENGVIPRLDTIEKCYLDTSRRYMERTDQMDNMESEISILKLVVKSHSELLQKAQ